MRRNKTHAILTIKEKPTLQMASSDNNKVPQLKRTETKDNLKKNHVNSNNNRIKLKRL